MNNILGTMSFLGCSLAVLGSPALEASNMSASVEASTRYEVDKYGCMFLASKGLTSLDENKLKAAGLSNIVQLDLRRNKLTSANLGVLSSLPNLKELSLIGNQISTLNGFPELPHLETLDLRQNTLTSDALKRFPALPNLKKLYLAENSSITGDDIITLASRFPKCEIIGDDVRMYPVEINSRMSVDLARRRVDLLDPSAVSELSEAKMLLLNDTHLNSLAELEKFHLDSLERLMVYDSKIQSLNKEYAGILESWNKLTELHICYGDMTEADASCLAGLKNLHTLNLSENKNLKTIAGLANLTNLHNLDLSGNGDLRTLHGLDKLTNLTLLSLEDTKIDPEELYEQLSSLSKLSGLYLGGTTIDTTMLGKQLNKLKELETLRIRGCERRGGGKLDLKDVTSLSAALPGCAIVSDWGVYKDGKEEKSTGLLKFGGSKTKGTGKGTEEK